MKHAINFRLDEVVLKTIAELALDLHTSKTDIVEQSILQFAAKVNHKKITYCNLPVPCQKMMPMIY